MDTAYGPPETECKNFSILSLACLRYIFIKEHKLLIALLLFQICMTRRSALKLVQPHEDPEKLFRSNRKLIKTTSLDSSSSLQLEFLEQIEDQLDKKEEVANMATPTMEEYMTTTRNGYGPSVVRPNVCKDKNFEIKGQFLKELRTNSFSGLDTEDPNEHIEKVLEIIDLFHIPDTTIDQVMLRAFPMSLTGAANRWLKNLPSGTVTTWEILKQKFLAKYCPPARTAKKMEEINNFQQEEGETLYNAWERFKELILKCPQHYLTDMQEVIAFYKGLDGPTKLNLDSRGAIPNMKANDAKKAIQEMAEYSQKWHNGSSNRKHSTEESDLAASVRAQIEGLRRELKKTNEKVYAAQVGCEICKGPHYTKDCPHKEGVQADEEACYTQFRNSYPQGQFRAAAPGFYQRNNGNPSFQERRQSLEETVSKFINEQNRRRDDTNKNIDDVRASTEASLRNMSASIKALEIQIGQLSKIVHDRSNGSLPSSTIANPRDQVKAAEGEFVGNHLFNET